MLYEKIMLDENSSLEIYAQNKADKPEDALLIIPGGGYGCVCADREGEPIAHAFVEKGCVAFVLTYSVGEMAVFPRPLIEASLAIKYIKDNAGKYGIDKDRVFATGFSAGGHLCTALGTMWHIKEIYDAIDMPYGYNKPTGIMPIYPVISATERGAHMGSFANIIGHDNLSDAERKKYSLENRVDDKSSPAFIVHTSTDQAVSVYSSLALAKAYADRDMPFELHVFREAPHGMALANEITWDGNPAWVNERAATWPDLARSWMKEIK